MPMSNWNGNRTLGLLAACATGLALSASSLWACVAQPGAYPLDLYDNVPQRRAITKTLEDISEYFDVTFQEVCVSQTLFQGQADVLRGELTLGLRFLSFYAGRVDGTASLVVLLAHESAHLFQQVSGWFDGHAGASPTLRCIELHADFLAGGYARRYYEARNGPVTEGALTQFFSDTHGPSIFYGFGNLNNRTTALRGGPSERFEAFAHGFDMDPAVPAQDRDKGWNQINTGLNCA